MAASDDEMTFSNRPFGISPCQGKDDDESSIDIYDGLDSTPVVSISNSADVTLATTGLNLFDEILIEEGTAKEATYKDLQAEHEKCQQQLQDLTKKFKEIQEQNSTLQNENQSLKKNISALIKTARVEINRKDEEISSLQRRLAEVPFLQKNRAQTSFPGSASNPRHFEGSKSKNKLKDVLPGHNSKTDPRNQQAVAPDLSRNTENKKFNSGTRSITHIPCSDQEQLFAGDAYARLGDISGSCNEEKKKGVKTNEHQSRENDGRCESKAHKMPDEILDTQRKLQVNSHKTDRNGLWKNTKDLKLKNNLCTEKQTDKVSFTGEKPPVPKDRLLPEKGHLGDDRGKKTQNINHKSFKTQIKEESINAQKNRQPDKCIEQQITGTVVNLSERHTIVSSPQKLSKHYVEDRKIKDSDGRRSRGASSHGFPEGKTSPPLCLVSAREPKHGQSREDEKKHEHTHSKSNKHRTEEKRKNKGKPIDDKNPQTERDSKKTSQKIERGTTKTKNSVKEEKKSSQVEQDAKIVGGLEEPIPVKAAKDEEQSKSKDLKLSFMQKLNLTLSPAKKQTDKLKSGAKSTSKDDAEGPSQDIACVQSDLHGDGTEETKPSLLLVNDNLGQTNVDRITFASKIKLQIRNGGLAETLNADLPKTSCQQNIAQPDAKTETEEVNETLVTPGSGSPGSQHTLPDGSSSDLETISSVDFDTFRVIDEINGSDSDSSVDEGEASNGADKDVLVAPEKGGKPTPEEAAVEEAKMLSTDVQETKPKVHNLKPSFSDHGTHSGTWCSQGLNPTPEPRDSNPVLVDDESSILSVDLNQMRCIPKAISPLNSPMRPLPKALKMESPYKGPVKSYNIESTVACPGRTQSNEINKENQKPLCIDQKVLEKFQLSTSSDELEEGEIVSDDGEAKTELNSEHSKKIRKNTSHVRSDLSSSTSNHKAKSTPSTEDSRKRSKEKHHEGTVRPSKEMKKNQVLSIDCLEKIVQIIIEPSTIHEFMHMMRAIRKQIRRNYMKFKIHFPIQHFHRIIDSAGLNFTSLVKCLNFSKMTKSNETLKMNLCEVIESKLNQIKKNNAIEHLFKHQQSDMKKKLWKLVDEQLDHLFDKIINILLKLCYLKSLGNESGERKLEKRMKAGPKCLVNHKSESRNQKQKSKKPALSNIIKKPENCTFSKPVPGNQLLKRDHREAYELHTHTSMAKKSKWSYTDNTKYSRIKPGLPKEKSIEDISLKAGRYEKEKSQMVGDPHKPDISCGPLTEQQMSGLTFNLVSDAQMGEMFKSLLQGSDLSEKNVDFIDEHQWEFRTPEKHIPEDQSCEDDPVYEAEEPIPKENQVESKVLDGIKWPTVSPERDSTFLARLHMPIDPDILDESCMFEIPTSPALKKSEVCISEKPKSLISSVLLEDLAVSLTIPSPLKSDAHLSFLKPDVFGSVPEDVLSAHFSEDAHLEEEDVSEQDIHLALESDNSSSKSSCSSSWAGTSAAPGFQYCPSLPMQAVIMEKSNDHFIVKIRRAAPSTSPILDQSTDEALASFAESGSNEIVSQEKCHTLESKNIPVGDNTTSENNVNIVDSEGKSPIGKKQLPSSPELVKETSVHPQNDQQPVQSEPRVLDDVLVSVETWCSEPIQKQSCNMLEFLKEPYSNTRQIQGLHLLESHRVLQSDAVQEITCGLQDCIQGLEGSFGALKESSSKTTQHKETPEVFKLPQTHSVNVFGKRDASTAKENCTVGSKAVQLVEELSSVRHIDICTNMTVETLMENKVGSWDLTGQTTLDDMPRRLYKEEHKTEDYGDVCHLSEQVVNLREDLPDKPKVFENVESKTFTNDNAQGCETNLDKESKKRKKDTEGTSSPKRQRKESNQLACKKNSKSSKKSKEVTSEGISALNKKAALSPLSKSLSSLYAKNVVKKKGEVVISWTRNDDREILLECQKKGPSGKTFTLVATKLNKSPSQVEERFRQLVKLFKMSNCS